MQSLPSLDKKVWWEGMEINTRNFCILQTRIESQKPFIVSGVWWSVKLVLPTETQKSHFCVRPWSLVTILNFFERGPTDRTVLMYLLLLSRFVAIRPFFCHYSFFHDFQSRKLSKLLDHLKYAKCNLEPWSYLHI